MKLEDLVKKLYELESDMNVIESDVRESRVFLEGITKEARVFFPAMIAEMKANVRRANETYVEIETIKDQILLLSGVYLPDIRSET